MPCGGDKHYANPGAEKPYASEHDADNGPMEKGELGDAGVEREAEGRTREPGPTTRDGQGR